MKQVSMLLAAALLWTVLGGIAQAGQSCTRDVEGTYQAEASVQWGCSVDNYDDSQSHPLRIAAYLLHPIGYATEWLIMRPFICLVSQPYLAPIFGYRPHGERGLTY